MNTAAYSVRTGVAAAALVFLACGSARQDVPPELAAGHDTCLECGMIINELRFASGYVDGEGTSHGFDDLGCLAHYCRSHGLADSGPDLWVMDFHERTWKRATDAWFVRCDSMPTPMGYGFVALGDSLEAGRIAVPGTGRLRFDAFRRHVIEDQTSAATKE